MEFVTEQASSYEEAVRKIHQIYGMDYTIYSTKRIQSRRLFGLRRSERYEVTAYRNTDAGLALQPQQHRERELRQEKQEPESPLEDELIIQQFRDLRAICELNEFSPAYTERLLKRLYDESAHEELLQRSLLEARLLSWISDSIRVDRHGQTSTPRIFGLLGPTGVGKTTTIAKIAALHGLQGDTDCPAKQVTMITIDSYRIGARAQIGTFGEIMGIPVVEVQHRDELLQYLKSHQHTDLILIDTIGKSPRDTEIQQEMKEILSACTSEPSVGFSLALSASMKSSDMKRTIERFSEFPLSSIVLTKLDETEMVGNLISLFDEVDIPILYVTAGQKVPQDLMPMTEGVFLRRLQGFSVDLENLIIGDDTDCPGLSPKERAFLAH